MLMVCHNTGTIQQQNCFGVELPILIPDPPATITANFSMCSQTINRVICNMLKIAVLANTPVYAQPWL
jgi:hypothetical protein